MIVSVEEEQVVWEWIFGSTPHAAWHPSAPQLAVCFQPPSTETVEPGGQEPDHTSPAAYTGSANWFGLLIKGPTWERTLLETPA